MAATQFAVVYGTVSKVIRRFIEPDASDPDDGHIASAQANLAPGESLLALDLADFPIRTQAMVQAKIGVPAHSGRCVLVSLLTSKVAAVIQADPLIDAVAGHTLVQSDVANIGWGYAAGILTAPVIVQTPTL